MTPKPDTRELQNSRLNRGCLHAIALLASVFAAACSSTVTREHAGALRLERAAVMVMPVDVELSRLFLSGLEEPEPGWSKRAASNATSALRDALSRRGAAITLVDNAERNSRAELRQLHLLHEQVAKAIINHHFGGRKLEAKAGKMDWTLGNSGRKTGARYIAFLFLRDSYPTAGRDVFEALTPQGKPAQLGYLSIVDSVSGDVVWFRTTQGGSGDLRDAATLQGIVTSLLDGVPAT